MRVSVSNLTFGYDYRTVLKDVSFEIEDGDFLVVVGNNGSGKSTLVKCLLGINPVPDGKVFLDNKEINQFENWIRIGYVPQKLDDFNYEFPITLNEIMHVSRYSKVTEEQKLALLDRMGILELQHENINTLSGGQLQRVFIARALINRPDLLILDEPTVGVDKENVEQFYNVVNGLNEDGVTIILISHHLSPGNANYTHIMQLREGRSFLRSASDLHAGGDSRHGV